MPIAPSTTPTVAEFAAHWLAMIRAAVRPQTLTGYRSITRRMILPALGALPLGDVTRAHVRAWLGELLAEGRAPQTVARAHSVLTVLLNIAIDDGLLTTNVAHGLARRLRRSVRPRIVLELAQLDLFLDRARDLAGPRQWPLFVALAAGGLRVGEAAALRPEDIHPERPVITVARNRRAGGQVGPTKSGRVREVLVTETAAAILRDLPPHRSGWLFPGRRGPHPVSAEHVRKLTRQIAIAAGLPAQVTPRTFRRSYAQALRTVGASVAFVADQCGHASTATTERFYLDGARRADAPAILTGGPHLRRVALP